MIHVHMHIPKTGGTAISQAINQHPEGWIADPFMPKGFRPLLDSDVSWWANHRWLGGHLPAFVHRFSPIQVRYSTVLRDPIERTLSDFYKLGTIQFEPGGRYSDFGDQASVIRWTEGQGAPVTLEEFVERPCNQNLQTRMLAGLWQTGGGEEMEGAARAALAQMRWCRLEELAERGPDLVPGLGVDFSKRLHENRGRPRWDDLDQRIVDRIIDTNLHDMNLWRDIENGRVQCECW
jgi:hypothetical protein